MRSSALRHKCDIFERIHDGSLRLRATVLGRYEAQRKMQELAEHSENLFFTFDIETGQSLSFTIPDRESQQLTKPGAASA
jgi:hypothetical protein